MIDETIVRGDQLLELTFLQQPLAAVAVLHTLYGVGRTYEPLNPRPESILLSFRTQAVF
jgi:hypothetical protein